MDNPDSMRRGQSVRDLDGVFERFAHPHPFSRNRLVERLAIDKLHGDKHRVARPIDLMDRNSVGVIERGSGFSLLLEPRLAVRAGAGLLRKHFNGDQTIQPQVPSLVNDAHAALAQLLEDLKMGELAAWWNGGHCQRVYKS